MAYLAIVRKVNEPDGGHHWEIDEDSAHLFDDEGGGYAAQEVTISRIRAIETDPALQEEKTEPC